MINDRLQKQLDGLPNCPGVYIFKDEAGNILYIGKAKDLKKRVRSYFNRPLDVKTQAMFNKIADIECRLTSSEAEAQVLEASLIKDKQPYYNIELKDDKTFPWIRITREEFPRVYIVRRMKTAANDNSLYFGPYPDVAHLRQAFKLMRKIFGFRSCKGDAGEPCLYWRLNLCPAPCAGKISAKNYRAMIRRVRLFLESRYDRLIKDLSIQMRRLSAERKFEEAAKIRDQISALSAIAGSGGYGSPVLALEDLKKLLKLRKMPERIEAFDISNISGRQAVGSMVSFAHGVPDKTNYRRFRIKTVKGVDDFKMLSEVVCRRYTRIKNEGLSMPDLVLVDGGRAHLLTAAGQIASLGLRIPLVSIAKEKEHIYTLGSARPIRLRWDTPALNLIRRIRDEAHRFAISYHRLLRRKKLIGK